MPSQASPAAKVTRMLLGDADIEAASREALGEFVEAGARRHRRRDRDDALVVLGLGDQRLGEDVWCSSARRGLAFTCAPVATSNFTTP